jgi:hypothetical protein
MFIKWTEVRVQQEHFNDLLREAEQERLARQAARRATTDRLFWRIESAVGHWLVDTGCRLQGHVEAARQLVYQTHSMGAQARESRPCDNC